MEKVNQHLLSALQPAWRTALCGPAGCAQYAPTQTEVRQSRVKPLPVFLVSTMWRALGFAWRRKPQWVIAGSGLTAPIAWLAARCAGGRAAVYLHGLDIIAPSRFYQWLWLPFIRRCDLAIVNSENTGTLARNRGVPLANTRVLHPGTDLPTLDAESAKDFRRQNGFGQRPLLLSVGRLTQRKGLVEFVSKSLPAIASHQSDVMLVVIGDEASDALHAREGSELERIILAAQRHGVEQNVCFLGRCDDLSLSAAYQAANVHVFPVLELPGDVEGFGMVALESAAHGLPTIAFAVGGVPDAVWDGHTGVLIEPGNYVAFAKTVIEQLALRRENKTVAACRDFAAGKAWPVFAERLRSLLDSHRA
ncbi:phosphatidylinositol alpha-1,6-mannosyltransferase [Rhodanobacter sp. ANJX3]|uniref:glycosyltransferase family 4 protein n=1 Tax=Rhodanobacter sp. ANJX3 TaxID=2723083 RepID=UPI00161876EB|nr:glycosyltransferase family 4 protein [Rhodanobacter sp. ANJX3]MBB5360693.1 phosphatidylinositol alpha-1,6-mannosyltransferase [Rhodanobacter sp. ANJX3]